jgi:hypothetical protein
MRGFCQNDLTAAKVAVMTFCRPVFSFLQCGRSQNPAAFHLQGCTVLVEVNFNSPKLASKGYKILDAPDQNQESSEISGF